MCAIIAVLLLLVGGWFGFSTVGSTQTMVEPQVAEAIPVTAVAMTPTPTPAEPLVAPATLAAEVAMLPTQAIACASVSEDEDIANMLALVGSAFQPAVWTQEIGSSEAKTTATWIADGYGAVAFLEYLHYDCGVSQDAIDEYYSPDGFDVLLSNYTSHEQTAACAVDGLRLFEFNATFSGADYLMRYWVKQTSPTRVAGLMLVFPSRQAPKLDGFSERLFPELAGCAAG